MRTTLPGSATVLHDTPVGRLRLSVASSGVLRVSFAAREAAAAPQSTC